MEPIFHFPLKPYNIQQIFMKELYFTIDSKKSGIFESPTGTGKSLSLCCGAIQWIKDYYTKIYENLESEIKILKSEISNVENETDWLSEEYEKIQKNQKLLNLQGKLDKINKQKELFKAMKERVAKYKKHTEKENRSYEHIYGYKKNKDHEKLTPDEKENESESNNDIDLILEEVEEKSDCESDDEQLPNDDDTSSIKIYISSRTHSQLSQFIGEIKKTIFKEDTKVVTLASRKHYCLNTDVTKLKNVNLINERCLDLQKSKSKSTLVGEEGRAIKKTKTGSCTGCRFYNQSNIRKLKEKMLVDILDMEDIVKYGKDYQACPYYASRMALDEAEVVLISHAGIVSSGARSGISLKLDNNILILDEAHGLTAALENAHSAPVTAKQLSSVKTFLQFYINKYRSRLSSKNLLSVNQMNFVVGKLLGSININSDKKDQKSSETSVLTIEDFVIKAEIDHMNLRPLVEFCRNSKLAPKLHGFSKRYSQEDLEEEMKVRKPSQTNGSFEAFLKNINKKKVEIKPEKEKPEDKNMAQKPTETSAGSGLYAVLDFLERLCDRSVNGRILSQTGTNNSGQLKYLLLNPAEHFYDIVQQCRSVIVAGGTMEPISEFKALLTNSHEYNECDDKNLTILRCEHVVPADNVLGICLSKGPSNVALNFSYEHRMNNDLLREVGHILRNICSIVKGGVVCFLPSYSYEETVFQHLKTSKVLDVICKRKSVFREPKSAAEVDEVLNNYSSAIKGGNKENFTGALLLSVVGGKLSEGLNFSDDLGRCVIVVGMPYPNVKSPELQEKMCYLNKTLGVSAGHTYYENLCMKAVNQCVGRAVRHINDYASILLVDERYSKPQTVSYLPSFVKKSLTTNCSFGPTMGSIAKFFARHKKQEQK